MVGPGILADMILFLVLLEQTVDGVVLGLAVLGLHKYIINNIAYLFCGNTSIPSDNKN